MQEGNTVPALPKSETLTLGPASPGTLLPRPSRALLAPGGPSWAPLNLWAPISLRGPYCKALWAVSGANSLFPRAATVTSLQV